MAVYHVLNKLSKFSQNPTYKHTVHAHINGITLFWSVLTIVLTSLGLRAPYLFMVVLFIATLSNILIFFIKISEELFYRRFMKDSIKDVGKFIITNHIFTKS